MSQEDQWDGILLVYFKMDSLDMLAHIHFMSLRKMNDVIITMTTSCPHNTSSSLHVTDTSV
jgi:hypothetical protein